jgi:hypothetical protein
LEYATVDGRIGTIGKELEIIEDHRFNMFLPFEAGINTTLHKTVHRNGEIFNRMITEQSRHLRPPLRLTFSDVIKPSAIDLQPGAITIDISRVRSALKGIVNVEMKVFEF